jgi:hypothetical protein
MKKTGIYTHKIMVFRTYIYSLKVLQQLKQNQATTNAAKEAFIFQLKSIPVFHFKSIPI